MATSPQHGGPTESGGKAGTGSRVYDLIGYIAGLILAIIAGSVFLQVVLRALGKVGIDGLEEVPRYLFVWLVMLGAAAAMWRNEHTVLDYFLNRMPPRLRAATNILTNLLMIGLFVWLVKLGFTLVPNMQFQTSAGLNLPLGYVAAAIPVGSALIVVPLLRNVWREFGILLGAKG